MVNSIKAALDKNTTISEIRLMLGTDSKTVCVVVEGDDDESVFAPLLSSNVSLFQSFSGKAGVEEIIGYFHKNKRVVGIRDRDYLRTSPFASLFLTDYCCLELMIISIPSCFERLFSLYYRGTLTSTQLRLLCLSHLERFSKLRRLNEHKRLNIKLGGISMINAYNDNYEIMDNNLFCEVKKQNPSIDVAKYTFLQYESREASYSDLLSISNGHDFIEVFFALCNRSKIRRMSVEGIKTSLFCCFGKTEFEQTKLYSSLWDYQITHGISLLT